MKRFILVVALLALALSTAVAQDTVTIQFWSQSSSPIENEALEAQVAAFEEANPGVDVELLFPPDYAVALQSAFASGDYPDVFTVGQAEIGDYVNGAGTIAAAEDNIVEPDDIYPDLLNVFTIDETVYCPPKDFSTLGLLYNRDHFDEAGLEYPTADWTWDDFRAAAEALTTDDRVGFSAAADWARWMAFVYQNGGSLTDEEGNVTINSPEAVEALGFYGSLVTDGFANTPQNLDAEWNGEAFGEGSASMTIEGNWSIGYLQENFPDLNWGVVEIPSAPNGPEGGEGTLTFTVCLAVGANTDVPEQAWALVNFLTGPEGAAALGEEGFGPMPARASAAESWLTAVGEEYEPFVAGAANATAPVFPSGFGDFTDALANGSNALLSGEADAQEVLDEAAEIAQELFEEME